MTKFDIYILKRIMEQNWYGYIITTPFVMSGPRAYLLIDNILMIYDKNTDKEYRYEIDASVSPQVANL